MNLRRAAQQARNRLEASLALTWSRHDGEERFEFTGSLSKPSDEGLLRLLLRVFATGARVWTGAGDGEHGEAELRRAGIRSFAAGHARNADTEVIVIVADRQPRDFEPAATEALDELAKRVLGRPSA